MFRLGKCAIVVMGLVAASTIYATILVPDSSILPAQLNLTISSKHSKAGEAISARIMQDVPLPGDARIPLGSILSGQVTKVLPAAGGDGGSISFRLDKLRMGQENIALVLRLRALASYVDVRQAQLPTGNDPAIPESVWNTVQIGGDVVYRGSNTVRNRAGKVGRYVRGGVLGELDSNPGRGCRNDGTGERAQALWLFSSDACGVYGLENVTIARPDRNGPAAAETGEITIQSSKGDVTLNRGSGLMLRVYAPETAGQ
jgi:hypothetical protein